MAITSTERPKRMAYYGVDFLGRYTNMAGHRKWSDIVHKKDMVPIKPIGDKVLVREDPLPEKDGEIFIAHVDNDFDEPSYKQKTGRVVGVGIGKVCRCGDGSQIITPPDVCIGDRVAFDHFFGVPVEWEGETLRMLEREEVLAVLEDD